MKTTALTMSALALVAAGCGAQAANPASATHGASRQPSQVVSLASTTTPRCTVSHLSLRLGTAGHAAGSTYRPIIFTNKGTTSCTLRGYPGVSYVAPSTGAQVGAAATRSAGVTVRTVTLAPGGRASALLQLVNSINYPPSRCAAKPVSGELVQPYGDFGAKDPMRSASVRIVAGSTAAAYVAFAHSTKACSTNVQQLSVRAVVKGQTGQ